MCSYVLDYREYWNSRSTRNFLDPRLIRWTKGKIGSEKWVGDRELDMLSYGDYWCEDIVAINMLAAIFCKKVSWSSFSSKPVNNHDNNYIFVSFMLYGECKYLKLWYNRNKNCIRTRFWFCRTYLKAGLR